MQFAGPAREQAISIEELKRWLKAYGPRAKSKPEAAQLAAGERKPGSTPGEPRYNQQPVAENSEWARHNAA
jgi:hypothetical protein